MAAISRHGAAKRGFEFWACSVLEGRDLISYRTRRLYLTHGHQAGTSASQNKRPHPDPPPQGGRSMMLLSFVFGHLVNADGGGKQEHLVLT